MILKIKIKQILHAPLSIFLWRSRYTILGISNRKLEKYIKKNGKRVWDLNLEENYVIIVLNDQIFYFN